MVAIYDVESGAKIEGFEVSEYTPLSMAWLSDTRTLVLYGCDGRLRLVDIDTYLMRVSDRPLPSGIVSADGAVYQWTEPGGIVRALETTTGKMLGTLVYLSEDRWLAITPDGHYRQSPSVEWEPIYVVDTDSGQQRLTAEQFFREFGWSNKPQRVDLELWNLPGCDGDGAPADQVEGNPPAELDLEATCSGRK